MSLLTASAYLLALTSLVGMLLFALYGRLRPSGGVWLPGVVHGALGVGGAALLALGLRGPPRGVASGAGSFGGAAAVLVGAALIAGLTVFAGRLRRRPPSAMVLGIHATFAVAGIVMLAAYLNAGS